MARKTVNRKELKVMIVRNFGKISIFCRHYDINYLTFMEYLRGREDMPKLNRKIVGIMLENGYDPYAETPKMELSPEKRQEIIKAIDKTYNSLEA